MAETIAAALVEAGWATATAAGVKAAFTYAAYAYAAYSIYDGQRKANRARDAARDSISDRLVTTRSSAASGRIVYGRTRVAADTIAYITNHGAQREYVTMVLPIAPHEIDAIEDIWFNDESIGPLDGDGYVTGGKFFKVAERVDADLVTGGVPGSTVTLSHAPTQIVSAFDTYATFGNSDGPVYEAIGEGIHFTISGTTLTWITDQSGKSFSITYRWNAGATLVRVKKFLGIAAGERDTDLEANSNGEWTSAHLGKGIARLHVTLRYDNDVFGTIGIPNITAIVRGKKVYNWASGVTAWSDNALLCTVDYLRSQLGFGIPAERFDVANL